MEPDSEIITRVLGGDVDAFRFLVERYERPVFRFILNVLHHPDGAEDVAQEVFIAAFEKLGSFDPRRSRFSTWLFTIARNKAINAARKRREVPRGDLPDRAGGASPSAALEEEEVFRALDRALEGLPPDQMRAFVLAEIEELSYEDVSRVEGVSLGAVRSRISRARQKVREALGALAGGRHGIRRVV